MGTERALLFVKIALAMALTGCEGYRCAEGVVKDQQSGMPLAGVHCKVLTGRTEVETDSTGKFDVCNLIGGCMSGCKDIVVEFSKEGYSTQSFENPEADIVVLMQQ